MHSNFFLSSHSSSLKNAAAAASIIEFELPGEKGSSKEGKQNLLRHEELEKGEGKG